MSSNQMNATFLSHSNSQLQGAQTYYERKFEALEERIRQLEKHIHYPSIQAAARQSEADRILRMKEISAKAQGSADKVPMRSDVETIRTLTAFVKRLIDREEFAYAVSMEVRNEARRALGYKEEGV